MWCRRISQPGASPLVGVAKIFHRESGAETWKRCGNPWGISLWKGNKKVETGSIHILTGSRMSHRKSP
jgi:hypothetical protein